MASMFMPLGTQQMVAYQLVHSHDNALLVPSSQIQSVYWNYWDIIIPLARKLVAQGHISTLKAKTMVPPMMRIVMLVILEIWLPVMMVCSMLFHTFHFLPEVNFSKLDPKPLAPPKCIILDSFKESSFLSTHLSMIIFQ